MADKIVPVRYVGAKPQWHDHLYGSGMTFHKGKVKSVQGWLASCLLSHPEFEDARPEARRGKDIDRTRPKTEEELLEAPLVNLEGMTKENLSMYAKRHFNLDLSEKTNKPEMIDIVRRQMGTDRPIFA